MTLEESVLQHVQDFHFNLGGITLWAPYLINFNYTEDPSVPRGLGKSSPEEILAAATYIHQTNPGIFGEAIRAKLVDGSNEAPQFNYKGIDCSGFVFYVMDRVYGDILGKSLAEDLSVPKEHVLNGARNLEEWKAAYTLSDEEAERLPEDVQMTWVIATFKRRAVNLCRVAGLVSDYSSVAIEPSDARIGDIVWMEGIDKPLPHAGIVTGIEKNSIQMTHSGRLDPADIGGVSTEPMPIVKDSLDCSRLEVPRRYIGLRRLRSLA
jgi:hypothetical protein